MRNIQETSVEVYHEIEDSLPECRDKVYGVFWSRPGQPDWTNREIAAELGWDACSVTPRVYELRLMGLLEFSRKRYCSITQRRVMAWRLATKIRAS